MDRDIRTAALSFLVLTALFATLGIGLLGVHGFTGMHDAAAAPAPVEHVHDVAVPATTTTTTAPTGPLVVPVVMDEFSYAPRRVQVPAGQDVVLEVTNAGALPHELVIGDDHVQEEAEAAMRSSGATTTHAHGDVPTLYLEAGETGRLQVRVDEPGTLLLGCHVPGHWDAGMKAYLDVNPT